MISETSSYCEQTFIKASSQIRDMTHGAHPTSTSIATSTRGNVSFFNKYFSKPQIQYMDLLGEVSTNIGYFGLNILYF